MGMCERRTTVDNISSRRVREREHPPCILHLGFCQFEHGIHRVPAGGHRVPGVYALHHLAIPDEAGKVLEREVLGCRLIRFAQNWGYLNTVEAPNGRSFVKALACWRTLPFVFRFLLRPILLRFLRPFITTVTMYDPLRCFCLSHDLFL